MTNLPNLIERLEAASGPSRELDAEIFIAACYPTWRIQTECKMFPEQVQQGRIQEPDGCGWRNAPAYTASVDAAFTLVPVGDNRWPQLDYVGPNPNDSSKGHRWAIWLKKRSSKACRGHSKSSSALALAAAALRAQEVDRG